MNKILKRVRPDERGRITLGEISKSISSYDVELKEDGKILLIPYIEIPKSQIIKLMDYQKESDNSIYCKEINDSLSHDDYNMGLNFSEIESVKFPETEEIELDLIVDQIDEDDSDSWS